jgi:tetratricopeptide (TPR) repeat protein
LKEKKEPEVAGNDRPERPSSSEDWASAVERWVQGGFKAEDMPDFIRSGAEEQAAADETDPSTPEPTEGLEPIGVIDESPDDGVEQTLPAPGSEVPQLDDIVQGFLDVPAALPSDRATAEASPPSPEPALRAAGFSVPAAEPVQIVEPTSRVRRSLLLRTFGWPPPLAFALGALVVGLAAFVWRVFVYENPETIPFPTDDAAVAMVTAPNPSDYPAKPKAAFHYSRGNRFAHLGRFTEAIAEYQQALREDPDYPHPHRALGTCYAALGDGSLAATSYRNYLKLVPEGPDAAAVREILQRYPGK